MEVDLDIADDVARKITFKRMDPSCIAPDLGEFDVVIINNVLSSCSSPKGVLSRMGGIKGLVKPGGPSSAVLQSLLVMHLQPSVGECKAHLQDKPAAETDM